MRSKKCLSKYIYNIIIYFCFCIALITMRIFFSSITISKNPPDNSNFVSIIESNSDENYDDDMWVEFQSEGENITKRIEASIQRITSICEKYNNTINVEHTHFLYSPQHSILYCWIRKVASTSFTKLFADFRGIHMAGNFHKRINALAPKNIDELLNIIDHPLVLKFLVVRHPFERLVSFYRSRIEDNSRYTDQAWMFVQKIFYLTRPQIFHFNQSTGNILQQIFYNDRRLKLIPSFEEFIIWLLQQPLDNDDLHWSQYHSHCSVCQIQFDYILKLDSHFTDDINHLYAIMNLKKKEWKLPQLGDNIKGSTNFVRTCFYLSKLSKNILQKLYERYKIDFEMFDYNVDVYESCIN